MTMHSIIVPAYNEEKRIAGALRSLKGAEIIVVDDGSSDNTAKAAARYARVVRHPANRGKGAAMRTGAAAARGDIIIFIDADGQFEPSDMALLLRRMKSADMVIGRRPFTRIPWKRQITNLLTKLAVRLATGRTLEDPLSGFRAIRRRDFLALGLRENRFAIEAEMCIKALRRGLSVAEVPVTVHYRGERSKLNYRQGFLLTLYLVRAVLRLA
jgi:glycosyltransferase involved in cell wall biosynthesis